MKKGEGFKMTGSVEHTDKIYFWIGNFRSLKNFEHATKEKKISEHLLYTQIPPLKSMKAKC